MSAISVAWDFLTDPANWTGSTGILAYLTTHLELTVISVAIALAIAVPIGVGLGCFGHGGFLAINISNAGRAIPTLAVLIIFASTSVGIGNTAVVISLVLFGIPPILTNAYVGIRGVDAGALEAARGMGMTFGQRLRRVQLPLAMPLIAAGVRTAAVQIVATATLAAIVGGGGLGQLIVLGIGQVSPGKTLAGAILVALFALVVEGVFALVQRGLTPPPLRQRGRGTRAEAKGGSRSPSLAVK